MTMMETNHVKLCQEWTIGVGGSSTCSLCNENIAKYQSHELKHIGKLWQITVTQ